jgi:hypothetical protein
MMACRARTLALLAAAAMTAFAACTSSTASTTSTPITGIEINASTLVAGLGCGTKPGEVYRYAAVVSFQNASADAGPVTQNGMPLTNIFECWTNGVFENLPSSDAGSLTFHVDILAYDYGSYIGAGLPSDLGCPPVMPPVMIDGCVPGSQPLTQAQENRATWRTGCTATQQAGTPVFAICPPLVESGDASADAARESSIDAAPDATVLPPEASTTEGGMASPDAADASTDGPAISNGG